MCRRSGVTVSLSAHQRRRPPAGIFVRQLAVTMCRKPYVEAITRAAGILRDSTAPGCGQVVGVAASGGMKATEVVVLKRCNSAACRVALLSISRGSDQGSRDRPSGGSRAHVRCGRLRDPLPAPDVHRARGSGDNHSGTIRATLAAIERLHDSAPRHGRRTVAGRTQ